VARIGLKEDPMNENERSETVELRDDVQNQRFEMDFEGEVAFLDYRREGNVLHLIYPEVPAHLRGRGVGDRLVRAVLERARAEDERVVPHCPYVKLYLRRHPEYADLLAW
jgi:predicted GNAT family acetyltransferase